MEKQAHQTKTPQGINPLTIEKLVNLKLMAHTAEKEITYEKFIGHKIKSA